MGNSYSIGFKPMIGYDDSLHYFDMELKTNEVYVLWALGNYGPMTSYGLYQKKAKFPFPEDATIISPYEKITEIDPKDYHRSTIDDSIRKLEDKRLVKILNKISKTKRVAGLTFPGIIWYLQNTKDGFNSVHQFYLKLTPKRTPKKIILFEEYENLIPFLPFWKTMTETLGNAICLEKLESTAKEFFALKEVKLTIKPLDFDVEGFLQLPPPLWMKDAQPKFYHRIGKRCKENRNQKAINFIKKPENLMLLNCYIAYLAIHDLSYVSKLNKDHLYKIHSELDSEKELAYFEEREIGSSSLFSKERIQEFFPKYSGIQYFFTGMFVEHLIWRNTDSDFELRIK
jgi:hypothetical protein